MKRYDYIDGIDDYDSEAVYVIGQYMGHDDQVELRDIATPAPEPIIVVRRVLRGGWDGDYPEALADLEQFLEPLGEETT